MKPQNNLRGAFTTPSNFVIVSTIYHLLLLCWFSNLGVLLTGRPEANSMVITCTERALLPLFFPPKLLLDVCIFLHLPDKNVSSYFSSSFKIWRNFQDINKGSTIKIVVHLKLQNSFRGTFPPLSYFVSWAPPVLDFWDPLLLQTIKQYWRSRFLALLKLRISFWQICICFLFPGKTCTNFTLLVSSLENQKAIFIFNPPARGCNY